MIRINLTRSRIQDTNLATQTVSSSTVLGSITGGGNEKREAIVKVFLILLFTGGLMVWESSTIRELNEESNRLAGQMAALNADYTNKQAEVDKVKDVEVQAKELEDKLKILKFLSKLRLREVKTLDFMQSSIPEKVWLSKLAYDSDEQHMEAGHFSFNGSAVTTEDLTEFVKRLEESAYLMDVIVIKNQEIPGTKSSTTTRDFLFTAEVENKK